MGEVFITTSNSQVLDEYWLSDIEASRPFLRNRMRLLLQVNNLFDQNYQSVAYRPMPGRNYACTIKFNF
jgi:iron complex outermembrane receptor protein